MSVRDKQRLSAVSTARWSSGKLVAIEVAMFAIVLCPGGVSTGAREPCTGASAKAPLLHRSAWRNISRMVSNRPSEMLETPPIYMSSSSPVVIPVRTTRTRTSRSLLSHVADNCVCTTHTHTTSAAATTSIAQVQTSSTTTTATEATTDTSTPLPSTLSPQTSTTSTMGSHTTLAPAASSATTMPGGHTTPTPTPSSPSPTSAQVTPTPTTTPSPMCPANSESLSGLPSNIPADCICLEGYTGSAGTSGSCTPCPAGQYKASKGPGTCSNCPAGKASSVVAAPANTTCGQCVAGTFSVADASTVCESCSSGKYISSILATTCLSCPISTFSSFVGASSIATCLDCPAGKYGAQEAASACSSCPDGSFAPLASNSSEACMCLAGYEGPDGGPCRGCMAGMYKRFNGTAPCIKCPSNAYSLYARSHCSCRKGYRRSADSDVDSGCLLRGALQLESTRTFNVDIGMGILSYHENLSALNQTFVNSQKKKLLLQVSLFFDAAPDSVAFVGESTTKSAKRAGQRRTSGWDDQDVKLQTPVTDDLDTFEAQQIEIQALLSEFLGPMYLVKSLAMTCGQGYFLSSTSVCEACAAGKYKSSILNDNCTDCPEHSTSLAGSMSIADCTCDTGYEVALSNESVAMVTDVMNINGSNARSNASQICKAMAQTVSREDAEQAATVVSGVIGAVVAVNVGVGVGSAVVGAVAGAAAGGAGGGSAGGGGGGGGGGCLALITQVQMLNQLGKVGGNKGKSTGGLSSFSQGFGWSNFEIGLADRFWIFNSSADSTRRLSRRKITKKFGTETNETANVTASCEFQDIAPKMETLVICFCILAIVFVCRTLVSLIVVHYMKKELPTSLMFPSWEGPVVLVQYLAICNTATETMTLACPEALATGITILLCLPFFLIAASWFRIKRLVRNKDLEFVKHPRPSLKEARTTLSNTNGCFGKIVMVKILWNKFNERGDWEDNAKSVMWAWLASNFVGSFWIFAVWSMTKKFVLSAVLNLTDGKLNALLALFLQFSDSALILFGRPHIDRKTDFNECFGAITNLITYCLITLPDIADVEMPSFFGDMFQACVRQFAYACAQILIFADFLDLLQAHQSLLNPVHAYARVSSHMRTLARQYSTKLTLYRKQQMVLATSATAMGAILALIGPLFSLFTAGASMPSAGCFAGSAVGAGAAVAVYGNVVDEVHDQLEDKYAPGGEEGDAQDAVDLDIQNDDKSATSETSSHPEVVQSLIRSGSIGTAAAVAAAAAAAASASTSSKSKSAGRDKAFFKMTLELDFEEAGEPNTTKRKLFERAVINDLSRSCDVPNARFEIVRLAAGSIVVVVCIHPDEIQDPRHPPALAVAQFLKHESLFDQSMLYEGKYTQHITDFEVITAPDKKQLAAKSATSSSSIDKKGMAKVEADLLYESLSTKKKGKPSQKMDSLLMTVDKQPTSDAADLIPDVKCGVGIVLGVNETGQPVVKELEKGGAAESSFAIVKDDVLYSVDDVAVTGKDLFEINELLLGAPGSFVQLQFRRQVGWMEYAEASHKESSIGARADTMLMPIGPLRLERSRTGIAESALWKPPRPSVESFGEADTPSPELTMRDFQSSFGKLAQLSTLRDRPQESSLAERSLGNGVPASGGDQQEDLRSDPSLIGSSRKSSDEVSNAGAHSDASSDLVRPTGAAAPASLVQEAPLP